MVNWYVDKGLGVLIAQVKAQHPGMVIGTIGDLAHQKEPSDHNPSKEKHDLGAVDAADFMVSPHFTKSDGNELVDALVMHRDRRIAYIIWQKRIISATVSPWVWRPYNGTDPHTGHVHTSVNDLHESDTSPWILTQKVYTMSVSLNGYTLPKLVQGDDDNRMAGYNYVNRAQQELNWVVAADLTVDGVYGPATVAAVKKLNTGDGKTIGLAEWIKLYGLAKSAV